MASAEVRLRLCPDVGCQIGENMDARSILTAGACSNRVRVRRLDIEREVLAGLQREMFNDDVIQFAIGEFEKQLRERIKSVQSDVEGKRRGREILTRGDSKLGGRCCSRAYIQGAT